MLARSIGLIGAHVARTTEFAAILLEGLLRAFYIREGLNKPGEFGCFEIFGGVRNWRGFAARRTFAGPEAAEGAAVQVWPCTVLASYMGQLWACAVDKSSCCNDWQQIPISHSATSRMFAGTHGKMCSTLPKSDLESLTVPIQQPSQQHSSQHPPRHRDNASSTLRAHACAPWREPENHLVNAPPVVGCPSAIVRLPNAVYSTSLTPSP